MVFNSHMNENYARGAEAAQEHIDTFGLSSAVESASLVEALFGRMDWWRIGYVTTVKVAMERQWA